MSELKHQLMLNKEMSWVPCYIKSEADKVICHHKYKRCLAMAKLCKRNRIDAADYRIPRKKWEFYDKWYKRWLEIAEKFKPNNEVNNG